MKFIKNAGILRKNIRIKIKINTINLMGSMNSRVVDFISANQRCSTYINACEFK